MRYSGRIIKVGSGVRENHGAITGGIGATGELLLNEEEDKEDGDVNDVLSCW